MVELLDLFEKWEVKNKRNETEQEKKKNQGTWFAFVAINNIWCLTKKNQWKDFGRMTEGNSRERPASICLRTSRELLCSQTSA